MKERFCLYSYMFRYYPLEKAFSMANDVGLERIELWGGRPHAYPYDMDESKIEYIRQLSIKYGIKIQAYTPELLNYPYNLCSRLEKERKEAVEYVKRSLDVAEKIKTDIVVLPFDHAGYGQDRREIKKIFCEQLEEIGEVAEKTGVRIALEPVTVMESNFANRLEDILDILDCVHSVSINAMIDNAPIVLHQENFTDYVKALGKRLIHFHFIDCDGIGPHHYNIGEAGYPLEELIKMVEKTGYSGGYTLELIWPFVRDPVLYTYDTGLRLKNFLCNITQ